MPVSLASVATSYRLDIKVFERQYKDHLSNFRDWSQWKHADKWILIEKNIGAYLSIDEVALSKGELYTIITNKANKGREGSVVAIVEGTKIVNVAKVLKKIRLEERKKVIEVTLDMSPAMEAIVRESFPKTYLTTDRFHVQQLVSEAIQEARMSYRREAIQEENKALEKAKKTGKKYVPKIYSNGDTKKQLLARSRHLVFIPRSKWNKSQKERSKILFKEFPKIRRAYVLSMMFRNCYELSNTPEEAKERFDKWYEKVENEDIRELDICVDTVKSHEETILNYFINRSTNAGAESFNAKIKGFRSIVRGVRDKKFFLFRIFKIYG
jgi:transposase